MSNLTLWGPRPLFRGSLVDFDTAFGRGTLIMRTFMDEVRYSPSGNEVTLIKHAAAVVEVAADQAEVVD